MTRPLFFQMMTSLDGFVARSDGALDWHTVDDDFVRHVDGMLRSIDGILLGRVTYEGFASYWPTAEGPDAALMNSLPKYVFSRTLKQASWNNSRVMGADLVTEVQKLKSQPGKPLAFFGSPTLATSFVKANLFDEYRVFVNPVVLGSGLPMFPGLQTGPQLELTKHEVFASGLTCLSYRPKR